MAGQQSNKPPKKVVEACRALEADPACEHDKVDEKKLLGYREYPDKVVVIIETGQKHTVFNDDLEAFLEAKKIVDKREAVKPKKPVNTRKQ